VIAVAVVANLTRTAPEPGHVEVSEARSGRDLWSATAQGGYVLGLAATARAFLVADADDCIHGGRGRVEVVTAHGSRLVHIVSGCAVYRAPGGIVRQRVVGRHMIVSLPRPMGGETVTLPCPCGKVTGAMWAGAYTVALN
jgi:hypothetical protein